MSQLPKESIANFHVLTSRVRLTGTLTTVTGLRIGSGGGGDNDAVDLPVLRGGDGYPFIPGASLKGSIRSTLEALVRGLQFSPKTGLYACNPLNENVKDPEHACGSHESGKRKEVDPEKACAICRLMGSRVVASHVRFTDVLVDRDRLPHRVVELRDGVAIDRDLRTVHSNRKYDFEVVPPGVTFKLEVFVENPSDWLMGLLMIGFDQVRDGFTALGGFTSRGLGRVQLDWHELTTIHAQALLSGQPARIQKGDELSVAFDGWRAALAEKVAQVS